MKLLLLYSEFTLLLIHFWPVFRAFPDMEIQLDREKFSTLSVAECFPLFNWHCFFTKSSASVVLKRLMRLHDRVRVSVVTMASVTKKERWVHWWVECHLHHLVFPLRQSGSPPTPPRCVHSSPWRNCVSVSSYAKTVVPHAVATSRNKTPEFLCEQPCSPHL